MQRVRSPTISARSCARPHMRSNSMLLGPSTRLVRLAWQPYQTTSNNLRDGLTCQRHAPGSVVVCEDYQSPTVFARQLVLSDFFRCHNRKHLGFVDDLIRANYFPELLSDFVPASKVPDSPQDDRATHRLTSRVDITTPYRK